jgi:hypothetical membrane protein
MAMLATRTTALAGMIAPVLFTTLVIVQGVLAPDYSHVAMPISALAAWPAGWIQRFNFCVFGSLMTLYTVGMHRGVKATPGGVIGFMLLMVSGVGIVLAGVFSWKMVDGRPTETPPHVAAAVMSFAATAAGLIVFSRRLKADPRWRDLAAYTLSSGVVVLLLFVTLGWLAIEDDAPLHPWAGLLQRVICAVWFTCTIVLAVRLRRLA